ncbi:hypothetical protein Lalb_Chr22g0359481 [Lupinus albus]|uniref:Uncharacterized protein n=1 Tax=Lupinus albus TaxID=3870 RepID=A0A6A4NDF5_LUPAL|nr:hypothetical protein Lalb_Chr22g0359481 [Lupinus albus]
MFFSALGVNQNVINKYHYDGIQVWVKNPIHVVGKYCWCIGHSEGHHQVFKMPIPNSEGRLRNILRFHSKLVVTRLEINFRKYHSSS